MSSSSFDPFEARMQFLNLIRKLNASQQSIQKVVVYAIKYGSKCGEDLWECIIEQCGKGSLNTRINILYFLDTLLEVSLPLDHTEAPYPELVTKNLLSIVEKVVPDNRDGILNLRSAKQILESWRLRRVIDHDVVEEAIQSLDGRTYGGTDDSSKRTHEQAFSRTEILRRMEEDRERHKRLRERIWILPIPPLHPPNTSAQTQAQAQGKIKSSPSTTSPFTPASPSSNPWPSTSTAHSTPGKMAPPPPPLPSSAQDKADVEMDSARTAHSGDVVGIESALDMEFEQAWEGISEIDEEELTKMREDLGLAKLDLPIPA